MRVNFWLPVFDRFTCFRMSWTDLIIFTKYLSGCDTNIFGCASVKTDPSKVENFRDSDTFFLYSTQKKVNDDEFKIIAEIRGRYTKTKLKYATATENLKIRYFFICLKSLKCRMLIPLSNTGALAFLISHSIKL